MNGQISLAYGRAQAQEGMERVSAKAEKTFPGWLALGYAFVCLYVQRLKRGDEFTAEMLVEASVAHGIFQPHDDRAWASPILKAKREGLIEKSDKSGVCRKRHNSVCVLWRKA